MGNSCRSMLRSGNFFKTHSAPAPLTFFGCQCQFVIVRYELSQSAWIYWCGILLLLPPTVCCVYVCTVITTVGLKEMYVAVNWDEIQWRKCNGKYCIHADSIPIELSTMYVMFAVTVVTDIVVC